MKKFKRRILTTTLAVCLFTAAGHSQSAAKNKTKLLPGLENTKAWIKKRDQSLRSAASPLSLIGTYWLKEGVNSFGSGKSNDIVFPEGLLPEKAGTYILRNDSIYLTLEENTKVEVLGKTIISRKDVPTQDSLKYISSPSSILLQKGTVKWFVQINSGRYTIRILDSNSEAHQRFKTVPRYPTSAEWIIPGRFEAYAPRTTIAITNVAGITDQRAAAGTVSFTYQGKPYKLEALSRDGQLFFVFSDKTSETHSFAFRFLYTSGPGEDGTVILDFNQATNPNCAFSKFAPCPLPPAGNVLDIAIPAGEKNYETEQ